MNNKGANEVTVSLLLDGSLNDSSPQWKKLPRVVKQQLMQKLGAKNYNNIHDPRLYQDLDRVWKARKEVKETDIRDRAKLADKVECSICMETSDFGGKVTTLMCGHKFCTPCVLQHIQYSGSQCSCPLCRGSVFNYRVPIAPNRVETFITETENHMVLERKREKRRFERWSKRQRIRNHNFP
jgi:hypothetical protein